MDAFGYRNVNVEGYEADDVIASLAEQAKQEGIHVMVVTGDRDAYQLVDGDRVKVMTTSRGITDTRVYDRDGVIERYGIPPELVPDFIGLKGDTLRQHPRRPRHRRQDRRPAAAAVRVARGRAGAHRRRSRAPKRKENLRENADDARGCRSSWRPCKRDIEAGIDVARAASEQPDRSRLREVFREFELRDPLRRLEEALGDEQARGAARRCAPAARARRSRRPTWAACRPGRAGGAGASPQRGRRHLRWAAYQGGEDVLTGEAEHAGGAAAGTRSSGPLVAHDWKTLGAAGGARRRRRRADARPGSRTTR